MARKPNKSSSSSGGGGNIGSLLVSSLFHATALGLNLHYLNYSQWVFREDNSFGGQFKYLTQLNHMSQTVFFALSLFNDLHLLVTGNYSPAFNDRSKLHCFINTGFPLLFGIATMVGILFWSIFFWDRELILPVALESVYPRELNLFQHGWTAVLMWVEGLILVNHHYHSVTAQIPFILFVTLTYGLWTLCIKKQNGQWPYPFQDQLDTFSHLLFYAVAIPISILVLFLGRVICTLRWDAPAHPHHPQKQQQQKQQQGQQKKKVQ